MAYLIQGSTSFLAKLFKGGLKEKFPRRGLSFFLKENESQEECAKQMADVEFNFFDDDSLVSDRRTFCSLNIRYRKDDPSQWMISLIRDSNLESSRQNMLVLTSIPPFPFLVLKGQMNMLNVSSAEADQLGREVRDSWVRDYISTLVSEQGEIRPEHVAIGVSSFATQETEAVTILKQHEVPITATQLKACLNPQGYVFKAICFLHEKGNKDTELFKKVLATYELYLNKIQSDGYLEADLNSVLNTAQIDEQIINYNNLHNLGSALETIIDRDIKIFEMPQGLPAYLPLKASMINLVRDLKLRNSQAIIDALLSVRLQLSSGIMPSTGHDFYPLLTAMIKIELASKSIMDRLATVAPEKHERCMAAQLKYRRAMHELMYKQVSTLGNKVDFLDKIQKIEAPFLEVLDVDRNPWIRLALQVLVNALTLVFTFGYANALHQAATGDFLFFSRPASAEALKILDNEMVALTF